MSSHVYLQHRLTTGYIWTVRYFCAKGFAFQQANNFQISLIIFDTILSPISLSNIRKLSRKLQTKLQVFSGISFDCSLFFKWRSFSICGLQNRCRSSFWLRELCIILLQTDLLSAWVGQQNTSQVVTQLYSSWTTK